MKGSERRAIRDVARHIADQTNVQQRTRHIGKVATTSPLTVYIDNSGVALPATRHHGYTPTVGDRVFVDNQDGDLVIEDKVGY